MLVTTAVPLCSGLAEISIYNPHVATPDPTPLGIVVECYYPVLTVSLTEGTRGRWEVLPG